VFSADDINSTNGTINLLTSSTLSYAAGKNNVYNGAFDIWQRGTSIATTGSYTADRWFAFTDSTGSRTVSRQSTSDTTNLATIQYCARFQRTAGDTSASRLLLGQSLETIMSIPYAGKTVTISYYARRGANYSSASNSFNLTFVTGTGTDQFVFSGYTGQVGTDYPVTLTTTWQRFTQTVTIPSNATEIGFYFGYTPSGTAGAADYFEITGVQMELGSTATTFSRAGGSVPAELALCQRYYYQYLTGTSKAIGVVTFFAATQVETAIQFPVTMRIAPTLVVSTGAAYYSARRVAQSTTTLTILLPSTSGTMLYGGSFSGLTAGQSDILYANNASSSIAFNSEI
jgi:hypothetical protein